MLHCRPVLLSSRKMTSVHRFAHPHSVFCDHRPNNHCTPSWPPWPHCCAPRWTFSSAAVCPLSVTTDWWVWVVCFSQGVWAAWSVCVCSSVADSHTVLHNVKTKTKAFQQEVWIMCRTGRSVRMFETCSTVHAWNPCYAKHTSLKSTILSLTSPFSNCEHEPSHRPPHLFTSSSCLLYRLDRGCCCQTSERGTALGVFV